jgi:hypothetical protein
MRRQNDRMQFPRCQSQVTRNLAFQHVPMGQRTDTTATKPRIDTEKRNVIITINLIYPRMSVFLKWLFASLLCMLPFCIVFDLGTSHANRPDLDGFANQLSGMEKNVVAFARATRRLFASNVSPNPMGSSFLASDPEHLRARDAYLKTVFKERSGRYYYPSFDHGKPILYELKGLSLEGPYSRGVSNEGKAVGIDSGLLYHYQVEAFRIADTNRSAHDWIPGAPQGLESFTLIRQGMNWSIDSSNSNLLP